MKNNTSVSIFVIVFILVAAYIIYFSDLRSNYQKEDDLSIEILNDKNIAPENIIEKYQLVKIKSGKFLMGTVIIPKDDGRVFLKHNVILTDDYYIGKYEVTQSEWYAVMQTKPWKNEEQFKEGNLFPAMGINWNEAKSFCNKLNKLYLNKLPKGYRFSLPTEAQWEYACRAGTITPFSFSDHKNMGLYVWYNENTVLIGNGYPHQVGTKLPNPWGLYDMHGNVGEWCEDYYAKYNSSGVTNPKGPKVGDYRIIRGGGWRTLGDYNGSAFRGMSKEKDGFCGGLRLAISKHKN